MGLLEALNMKSRALDFSYSLFKLDEKFVLYAESGCLYEEPYATQDNSKFSRCFSLSLSRQYSCKQKL